jgi:hypothetical protein
LTGLPAAAVVRSADEDALDALRRDWGHAYAVGRDDEHGWWAVRHGQVGRLLKAGGPGGLRAAMAGDCESWPLWCADCGKRVTADAGGPPVHTASGHVKGGPDGHAAAPAGREPPLWKAAREITADYGGAFTVSARFGFLRADLTPGAVSAGGTPVHYEADDEAGMRRQLDAVAGAARRGRSREGSGR